MEDIHYQILKRLESDPRVSQRELAEHLGVSLGKAKYCPKALIEKGQVKVNNFKNSINKRAYLYLPTPEGIEAKARISVRFLQRKMKEYQTLHAEIEQLQNELKADGTRTRS